MFDTPNTSKVTLAKQVKSLFTTYELTNKVIVYVKDEGTNLNMLASTLTNVVSCESLQLPSPFSGTFFGHVMFKANMPLLIKNLALGWRKWVWEKLKVNCRRPLLGERSWARVGKNGNLHKKKLAWNLGNWRSWWKFNLFPNFFFQETLGYVVTINLCYSW